MRRRATTALVESMGTAPAPALRPGVSLVVVAHHVRSLALMEETTEPWDLAKGPSSLVCEL